MSQNVSNLTSEITLSPTDPDAYIELEIVVKNNSDFEAGFNDIIYLDSAYDNENIVFTTEPYSVNNPYGIHHMDKKLKGDELRTFRVKIEYKDNVVAPNNKLKSTIKFEFIPWSISGANAVFENILNTPEKLEEFESKMDDIPQEGWIWKYDTRDDSYISNAGGAAEPDYTYIDNLFKGNTFTYIENSNGEFERTDMTIFVKRADLDNNPKTGTNGKEMILFMTADKLDRESEQAIVYAYVYTRYNYDENDNLIENAEFELIGEMFEGSARIVSYRGNNGTGSFTTNEWKHTKDYNGLLAGKGLYDTSNDDACGTLRTLVRVTQGVEDPEQYN